MKTAILIAALLTVNLTQFESIGSLNRNKQAKPTANKVSQS